MMDRNEADEAAIARAMPEAELVAIARESGAVPEMACACVGPPEGCTICHCHIRAEALSIVMGRPCAWCEPAHPTR